MLLPAMSVEQEFDNAVAKIGKSLLEPQGFSPRAETKALVVKIHGWSFLRPRDARFSEGVGLWVADNPGRFTVELGVVPKDGRFFDAALLDDDNWLKFGRRERLGVAIHGPEAPESFEGLLERDFVFFRDQMDLERRLHRAILLALQRGQAVWDRFAKLLAQKT